MFFQNSFLSGVYIYSSLFFIGLGNTKLSP